MNSTCYKLLVLPALFCVFSTLADASENRLTQTVTFPLPVVTHTSASLTRVQLAGCEPDIQTGLPVLPVTGLAFSIPPNVEVASVTIRTEEQQKLLLSSLVEWGVPPIQPDDPPLPDIAPDPTIYQSTELYPNPDEPVWRLDGQSPNGKRLSVKISPIHYLPAKHLLYAAQKITVDVLLRDAPPVIVSRAMTSPLYDAFPHPLGESYNYVIVSTSNLIHNTPAPWNFQTLCEARAQAGLVPLCVSTEWISANYPGTNLTANIRAFVQDAYTQWKLRFLLIGGTFDLIPTAKLHIAVREFFDMRTSDIPSDALYYGCLDGPYDGNNNGQFGELTDGVNGGDIDLVAEVMVGRFPVANAIELAHMIRKTLRYETAEPHELAPSAFVSEKMDLGQLIYTDGFMDQLRTGSSSDNLISLGFSSPPYDELLDDSYLLYDSATGLWNKQDALAFLNQNLSSLNHIGHASTKQCMKIDLNSTADRQALQAFTNSLPYFAYSQSCLAGAFDIPDCFAEQLVTVSNAAFAAIMNAREGWVYGNIVGGYSHRYQRAFWDAAFRGSATCFGEINESSRLTNLYLLNQTSANYWRWVYYELNLLGDPATPFLAALNPVPTAIEHTALLNTYVTQTAYQVSCTLAPIGIYDPQSIQLIWYSDRLPGVCHTQAMTQVVGTRFESAIPAHPAPTCISYSLHVRNHAGVETRWPETDPSVFYVTDRLTLEVRGSPDNIGQPSPDYGDAYFASGLVAVATAPEHVMLTDTIRESCIGFFGTGSTPQTGTNRTVTFPIHRHSLLTWLWQHEFLLTIESDLPSFPQQSFWVPQGHTQLIPQAPTSLTNNGILYAFAEWHCDGIRFPAAPAQSAPAPGLIEAQAAHRLTAIYLPADLDVDDNGLADWWEMHYYGTIGQDPYSDFDQDGFLLWEEFGDRTNPLDATQIPAPPQIVHVPLDERYLQPGPITLFAQITDTYEVAQASVRWRLNNNAWQITPLQLISNTLYTVTIGEHASANNNIDYQIIACDPNGRCNETPIHFVFFYYPIIDTSRLYDLDLYTLPTGNVLTASTTLYNSGNADLQVTLRLARQEQIPLPRLPAWDWRSTGQQWEISTNRCISVPYALHSQLVSDSTSNTPVRASITFPPALIGAEAKLTFKHWMHSEVHLNTTRAFDGGIIEFSTDSGQTFEQLRGPYTHTIYGWEASPWPDGTPCFADKGASGWQTVTFDLGSLYPERNGFYGETVLFRFHYGGDNNTDNEGWYLDDINLTSLLSQHGFAPSIPPTSTLMIPPGDFTRIFWQNFPQSMMGLRDDSLIVYFETNDPENPCHPLTWRFRIRDYPIVTNLLAYQSNTGDGRVTLATTLQEPDGEPITLAVHWSPDRGRTWQPTPLADITTSQGSIPAEVSDGTLPNVPTDLSEYFGTNQLHATWASDLAIPEIGFSTQILFRVTADNGFYSKSYASNPFTVDNIPPVFLPGSLSISPLSRIGLYAITDDLITLDWPSAIDQPGVTGIHYRLIATCLNPVGTSVTQLTSTASSTLSCLNYLDAQHAFQVVAQDPSGNISSPLETSLLILDASGDFDEDIIPTYLEELIGTLATDPTDQIKLMITPSSLTPHTLSFSWNSAGGCRYTLEVTPTLLPPKWTPLPDYDEMLGTGDEISITLPQQQTPSAFYRLRIEPPEQSE